MELREALKEQYHAGLAMLAECVEKCPDALWLQGEPPRYFWRIASAGHSSAKICIIGFLMYAVKFQSQKPLI